MQDRRTLYNGVYIDPDSIPSTAIELTNDIPQNYQFKTLYAPVIVVDRNAYVQQIYFDTNRAYNHQNILVVFNDLFQMNINGQGEFPQIILSLSGSCSTVLNVCPNSIYTWLIALSEYAFGEHDYNNGYLTYPLNYYGGWPLSIYDTSISTPYLLGYKKIQIYIGSGDTYNRQSMYFQKNKSHDLSSWPYPVYIDTEE